jgi:hypothetical protein
VEHNDRKYLSKKRSQAQDALKVFRGDADTAPPDDIVQRVRERWTAEHDSSTATNSEQMVAILQSLGYKRYLPNLSYFLLHLTQTPFTVVSSELEARVFTDFQRILHAYPTHETRDPKTNKRRPLDCSYLLYQILRHHRVSVLPEQVSCRDCAYHNSVYEKLAKDLHLGYWPIDNV